MPTAICPECDEEVYVDPEVVQGDVISCEECGEALEVVGLDPIELDPYVDDEFDDFDGDDDEDDFDDFD
jgi:lysine biosynthesis protein LysW